MALVLVAGAVPPAMAEEGSVPGRIVSVDYCADQYVLRLLSKDRIAAVSPDAEKSFSYMAEAAEGVPKVRPRAEDILVLQPDLIVRSYGGGPGATRFFEQAGVPVVQLGFVSDLSDVPAELRRVADALGAADEGDRLARRFEERLAHLRPRADARQALYMTPGGVTTGPGSLVHQLMQAAGLENFEETPGWRSLPLERLSREQPDVVVAAFFGDRGSHRPPWSAARHPIARQQLDEASAVVDIPGAWTACGGWFILDAIEAMASAPGYVEGR